MRWVIGGAAIGIAIAGIGLILRPPPESTWATLRAHEPAMPGVELAVDVTTAPREQGAWLVVDARGSRGGARADFLAGAPPQWIAANGGHASFRIALPADTTGKAIHLVVYRSTTGDWPDRIEHAISAPLLLRPLTSGQSGVRAIPMFDCCEPGAVRGSARLRLLVAGIFASAAVLLLLTSRRTANSTLGARFRVLALLTAVAAAAEGLGLDAYITMVGRVFTIEEGMYEERRILQQIAACALIAGTVAFVLLRLDRLRQAHVWLTTLGLLLYVVVAGTNAVSLHSTDQVLGLTRLGLVQGDWLKVLSAVLVLAGALLSKRQQVPP